MQVKKRGKLLRHGFATKAPAAQVQSGQRGINCCYSAISFPSLLPQGRVVTKISKSVYTHIYAFPFTYSSSSLRNKAIASILKPGLTRNSCHCRIQGHTRSAIRSAWHQEAPHVARGGRGGGGGLTSPPAGVCTAHPRAHSGRPPRLGPARGGRLPQKKGIGLRPVATGFMCARLPLWTSAAWKPPGEWEAGWAGRLVEQEPRVSVSVSPQMTALTPQPNGHKIYSSAF